MLSEHSSNFRWFLAGPLSIPERLAPRSVVERYPHLLDGQSSFHWRGVIKPELEKRGMEAIDPYSSDVVDYCLIYGLRDGYLEILKQCDGVVAVLMPYHWESIPDRESNLSVVIRYWRVPFIAYSPIVNLSDYECRTMTEVKRFVSIIPTCLRVAMAMNRVAEKGIAMPKKIEGQEPEEKEQHNENIVMVRTITCGACGYTYQEGVAQLSEIVGCPRCGRKLLEE